MRRLFVALLVALLADARELTDDDPDSDNARFMIVVEHEDGYHCSASLVSIRTGVTTARCARGGGGEQRRELWALAANLVSARPPAPMAAAARRVSRITLAGNGQDPDDPAFDMALLELEAPFGSEAHSMPIIMATSKDACDAPPLCHAIRALPALPGVSAIPGRRLRMRVVQLVRAHEDLCVNRVPHWAASRAKMMCLTGEELCERDLGGGVVCGGKLCGVLSTVVGEEEVAGRGAGAGPVCGDTLAAQSVALWRRFLQCAYTLRLCGSGTCAGECMEQRLIEDERTFSRNTNIVSVPTQTGELVTRVSIAESSLGWKDSSEEAVPQLFVQLHTDEETSMRASFPSYVSSPSRSSHSLISPFSTRLTRTTRSTVASPSPFSLFDASMEVQPSLRPVPEFEPNRPDFKAAPIQPTPVGLKAGEYGDNAAEYGGEEAAPARTPCTSVSPQVLAPTPRRPPPAPAPLSAPEVLQDPVPWIPAQPSIASSRTRPVYSYVYIVIMHCNVFHGIL